MPLRPCTFPGCPSLVPRGRCSLHQPSQRLGDGDPLLPLLHHLHKPFYNSAPWRRARTLYLSLHPICELCQCAIATEVHHILSLDARPDLALDPSNLQATCKPCHSRETVRQDGGFGNPRKQG